MTHITQRIRRCTILGQLDGVICSHITQIMQYLIIFQTLFYNCCCKTTQDTCAYLYMLAIKYSMGIDCDVKILPNLLMFRVRNFFNKAL